MEWLDYREQLRIGFNDEKKGSTCVSRIQNNLDELFENRQKTDNELTFLDGIFDYDAISREEYHMFCQMTGTRYGGVLSIPKDEIRKTLESHEEDFHDFLSYYMAFINCLTDRPKGIKKQELLNILEKAFAESRLKYSVLKDEGEFFVFPKGGKRT